MQDNIQSLQGCLQTFRGAKKQADVTDVETYISPSVNWRKTMKKSKCSVMLCYMMKLESVPEIKISPNCPTKHPIRGNGYK